MNKKFLNQVITALLFLKRKTKSDTVLIAALFCLYNRYVAGMATSLPSEDGYHDILAERLVKNGYMKLPQGYDHLKK